MEQLVWNSKNNMLFVNTLDGWGFGIQFLAWCLYQQHLLSIKPKVLRQYLFGDYRYADGKVLKLVASNADSLPMFSEFALKPIWDMYLGVEDVFGNVQHTAGKDKLLSMATPGMKELLKIVRTTWHINHYNSSLTTTPLQTSHSSRLLPQTGKKLLQFLNKHGAGSSSGAEEATRALLRRYHPLSNAVLDAIVEACPSPRDDWNFGFTMIHPTNETLLLKQLFSRKQDCETTFSFLYQGPRKKGRIRGGRTQIQTFQKESTINRYFCDENSKCVLKITF